MTILSFKRKDGTKSQYVPEDKKCEMGCGSDDMKAPIQVRGNRLARARRAEFGATSITGPSLLMAGKKVLRPVTEKRTLYSG